MSKIVRVPFNVLSAAASERQATLIIRLALSDAGFSTSEDIKIFECPSSRDLILTQRSAPEPGDAPAPAKAGEP